MPPPRRGGINGCSSTPTVLPGVGLAWTSIEGNQGTKIEGDEMAEPGVRVETVSVDAAGNRQISGKSRTTALLHDRRDDVEAAVRETSVILQDSVAKIADSDGWKIKTLEAKFGLTLTAEAGVVLSRASAEASFEVTITIERD
jgi:hypothetical protein